MRQFKFGSALLMTMVLVGCGGGGSDVPGKPQFTSQVSFGDSLSDVGSYQPGLIGSLGGGQFTINAASSVRALTPTPTNWTEMSSVKLGLGMPCAAITGGFGAASSVHATCFGYGEGGARITSASGVGNVGVGGPMTIPVTTQIATHLGTHGGFSSSDIVFVMAGANDVFTQAGAVSAALISPASAVQGVTIAATELATQINNNIIGKNATHVVVINVPDIASTPQATPASAGLLDLLVKTFNSTLKAGVPDSATVLNIDAYTASKDEVANPGKYLLSNVTTTACNLDYPANLLATSGVPGTGSSLACHANNLNGTVQSTSRYLFADKVHPTPYGHLLFATYVLQGMTNKGWY